MADTQSPEWWRTYKVCETLIGKRIKVDDNYKGTIKGIFGGPLELFFMVDIGDMMIYLDLSNPLRIDIIE